VNVVVDAVSDGFAGLEPVGVGRECLCRRGVGLRGDAASMRRHRDVLAQQHVAGGTPLPSACWTGSCTTTTSSPPTASPTARAKPATTPHISMRDAWAGDTTTEGREGFTCASCRRLTVTAVQGIFYNPPSDHPAASALQPAEPQPGDEQEPQKTPHGNTEEAETKID